MFIGGFAGFSWCGVTRISDSANSSEEIGVVSYGGYGVLGSEVGEEEDAEVGDDGVLSSSWGPRFPQLGSR